MRGLAIALGLALVRTAAAQPAPPPAPNNGEKVDAKALMQLGVKLLKSKDYLGALAVFKDAYNRFPSAKILINIGTTLKLLDRNAEAANAYQRFLDSSDADPDRRAEITQQVNDLDKHLARLAITAPPEAELQINTDEWAPSAQTKLVRVEPGNYVVHARRPGYKPFETAGTAVLGQQLAVTVELVEIPKERTIVRVPQIIVRPADEPRSRFGLFGLGHFDIQGGGAGLAGFSADIASGLELDAAAILGPNFGGYGGARFAFLGGTLRPTISAGMPVFFHDGTRYVVRGAVGLEIVANRHFAILVEVGVEHDLNPPASLDIPGAILPKAVNTTAFIPGVGATARL